MNPASIPDDEGLEELTSRAADEFMTQVDGGAAPDVEEFAGRHPQIAGILRRLLPALRAMRESDEAAPPRTTEVPPTESERPGRLGDFEIVREVGRGGMGVVYEAMQISLKRRVALKVLPFAAMLDPQRLQRFQNEARAAACLHHGNIVPVFAVGADRGVHFYAMQYIEGRNLADLIHDMRRKAGLPDEDEASVTWQGGRLAEEPPAPTEPAAMLSTQRSSAPQTFFRTTAELAVQAALALHHAHQEGVVHRDVKPANLMVDAAGRLWITDFGLAQVHNDPRLTTTGALVGTLRYMSPEQASGEQVVDHRTDLYSLGATLYELLTLRAAFDGDDRGTLLLRITQDEPAPPRKLNPTIPADLETIVGKAMAKSPAERYATAQALADDLRRFLDDKPIRAKRPSLLEKAAKWARRRRGLVATALGLLLLAVFGLTVSTVLIAHAYELLAVQQKKTDEAYQAEAKERKRSEDAAYKARQVLNFFTQVSEEDFPDRAELRPIRRKLLEKALDYYEDFIAEQGDDPSVQDELTASRLRAASLLEGMGAKSDALAIVEQVRLARQTRPPGAPPPPGGFPPPPPGGPGGFPFMGPEAFGVSGLLMQAAVQRDLKLTDEQVSAIHDLADKRRELLRGRRGDELEANETACFEVLRREQAKRLRQIVWQKRGAFAFNDPEIADALRLTTDQKERLHAIVEETGRMMWRPPRPPGEHRPEAWRHSEEYWRGVNDRLMSVLSEEQKAKWTELTGEPFQGEIRFGPSPPPGFGPRPPARPPME
jgi:eukaryotic-like serine/threonine-protein kinase